MHVFRYMLEGYLVFFECFAEFFTVFIVEDVKFRGVTIGLEFEKNIFQLVVSSDSWRVLIEFEIIRLES